MEGVELGALRMAEDRTDLVIRLVERHGLATRARLELPWPFEWVEADLLERPSGSWTPSGGPVTHLAIEPWEIRTLRLRKR